MGEWKRVKLGEICSLITKGATPRGEYQVANSKDAVAFVRAENVNGTTICRSELKCIDSSIHQRELKRSQLRDGDILITIAGAIGRTAIVDSSILPANINQAVAIIRLDTADFDRRFVLDYLRLPALREELTAISSGQSVQANLNLHQVGEIEIPCPPLPTQRRIAAVLGALDDKIEVNRKICENLEAQAQALFKAWFVDFEPFGGKRPEGWEEESLSNIATFLNGLAMQKFRPAVDEPSLPVLKIKELRQGFCDEATEQCTAQLDEKYIVHDGDVVFSWSGSLLVDFWCGGDVGLNQHLFKVTSARFDKWFYYAWTQHHLASFIKIAADKATTMGHITRDHLDDAKVLIPDRAMLDRLGDVIAPMFDMIVSKRIESRALAAMRDALLPKLMSGELAVEKVEG